MWEPRDFLYTWHLPGLDSHPTADGPLVLSSDMQLSVGKQHGTCRKFISNRQRSIYHTGKGIVLIQNTVETENTSGMKVGGGYMLPPAIWLTNDPVVRSLSPFNMTSTRPRWHIGRRSSDIADMIAQ